MVAARQTKMQPRFKHLPSHTVSTLDAPTNLPSPRLVHPFLPDIPNPSPPTSNHRTCCPIATRLPTAGAAVNQANGKKGETVPPLPPAKSSAIQPGITHMQRCKPPLGHKYPSAEWASRRGMPNANRKSSAPLPDRPSVPSFVPPPRPLIIVPVADLAMYVHRRRRTAPHRATENNIWRPPQPRPPFPVPSHTLNRCLHRSRPIRPPPCP